MEELIGLFAIFAIFIALPWMVLHYLTRRRDSSAATAGDPAMNANLIGVADKLERRIDAIESLLDEETPGWRRSLHRRAS